MAVRITIEAFGSRGDVQPYVALGKGLQRAGHEVTLLAGDEFEAFITENGLGFFQLGFRVRETISESEGARAMLEGRLGLIRGLRQISRTLQSAMQQMLASTWEACKDAEAVVFSTLGMSAYHVAERQRIPAFWALTMPAFSRTRSLPSPLFPTIPAGRRLNFLSHILAEQFWQRLMGGFFNRWRERQLGLPPIPLRQWPYGQLHGKPVPMLYGYSPAVIPRPPDWGEHIHVTGYWFLEQAQDWSPPGALVDFLAAGQPPVYVGFGSMASRRPEETTAIVVEALRQSGQRGVLCSGWAGIGGGNLPDTIFAIDAAPHDWLFPRMAAVVHHGGAGTVSSGLRAGVPTTVVPFAGDQPFWAAKVKRLDVGPAPIPRKQLTAERLAEAIRAAATDEPMRRRAADLGERIRAEDGVEKAVAIIAQQL
jgi:sterol 3beta-glucosyltransferase